MKLHELHNTLLEYRRDVTVDKQGAALVSAARQTEMNKDLTAEQIVVGLEQMDPTKTKSYMMWLIKQYTNRKMRLEDAPRIRKTLTAYQSAKPQLPKEQRDVNRFDLHNLEDLVDGLGQSRQGELQDKTRKKYKNIDNLDILYNGPLGLLAIPRTEEASCEIGSGTRWCTAARENNMFQYYNRKAPLYVFIEKPGNVKYQFHFPKQASRPQMMDARDREISAEKMQEFIQHPVVGPVFKKWTNSREEYLLGGLDNTDFNTKKYYDLLFLSLLHYNEFKNGVWTEFENRLLKAALFDYESSFDRDEFVELLIRAQTLSNNPQFKKIDDKEIDQKIIDYFIFEVRNRSKARVTSIDSRNRRIITRYYTDVKNGVWPGLEKHIMEMMSNIRHYVKPSEVVILFKELQDASNNGKFKNTKLSDILDGDDLKLANDVLDQQKKQ